MLVALQLGKPPDTVTVPALFAKVTDKVNASVAALSTEARNALHSPVIGGGQLNNEQWRRIEQMNNVGHANC